MSQNTSINKIKELLSESKNISIISHYSPDADAYGSSIGLFLILKELGFNLKLVNQSGISKSYDFFPEINNVKTNLEETDLLVFCDCGDVKRVGDDLLKELPSVPSINIDHHVSNTNFADYNYVISDASSTSEIIYEMANSLDLKISKDAASCLLAGIMGDTGSFRYSCTSSRTLEVASKLLELGADLNKISTELFQRVPLDVLKFQSYILSNNLEILEKGKFAELTVNQEDYDKFSISSDGAEGLVEKARDIEGVLVSAILRYSEPYWKVSLRSKDSKYNVSELASSFGGGGHIQAAAFRSKNSLDDVKTELRDKVAKLFS